MSIAQDLIALIDQRLRASRQMTVATGTIQTRDAVGPGAYVVFDGSTVGVPVKVPGSVFAMPGDRCTLGLHGVEWIVTTAFNDNSFGQKARQQFATASGPLTSSTYVELTDIDPIEFTKVRDDTQLRMSIAPSGYAQTATNTGLRFGLRMTPLDPNSTYSPITYEMGHIFFSQTGMHMSGTAGVQRVNGIPAGIYSCQVHWKRWTGTGTGNCNNFDLFVTELDEMPTGYVPVD